MGFSEKDYDGHDAEAEEGDEGVQSDEDGEVLSRPVNPSVAVLSWARRSLQVGCGYGAGFPRRNDPRAAQRQVAVSHHLPVPALYRTQAERRNPSRRPNG